MTSEERLRSRRGFEDPTGEPKAPSETNLEAALAQASLNELSEEVLSEAARAAPHNPQAQAHVSLDPEEYREFFSRLEREGNISSFDLVGALQRSEHVQVQYDRAKQAKQERQAEQDVS